MLPPGGRFNVREKPVEGIGGLFLGETLVPLCQEPGRSPAEDGDRARTYFGCGRLPCGIARRELFLDSRDDFPKRRPRPGRLGRPA
jgi:hypothetical protein